MNKLSKLDLVLLALFASALIFSIGYGIRLRTSPATKKPHVIDPALLQRAEKELSPEAIFKSLELKNKLRDRNAFMRECETLSREQLLERIQELTKIIKACEVEAQDSR
jgi:hypothetical protein